jgi:hypothetical protein
VNHLGDSAGGLLDRNGGIEPCRALDVDVIDAEPAQQARKFLTA